MKLKQFLIPIITIIVGIFLILFFPSKSYAQTVFIDDFSNDYEKWQDVRDTFDLWSIIDQKADVFVNRRSTLAELVPKDEYWNENWKNYIYKVDYTYLGGADKLLSWWYKDPLNWYQFHFVADKYILSHVKDGYEIWNKSEPFVLTIGQTYKMEVHANNGNIKFVVDGKEIFSVDDPTFNNDHGRIGMKSGAGAIYPTHVQFDNIEVELISNITDYILQINPLKQTNPLWKDTEYDSATNWATSKFGIGDWGCLLTSINMVLDYHDIKSFPDGTIINPTTLNNWLKNQEDGFLAGGLINWSAVTRLVKEIHDQTGSINLEYSRILNVPASNSIFDATITEIKNNNPSILEIPGHFFVVNGFTQNKDDLFITDPAYSYDKLSQHNQLVQSARLLTPSNTDLSYIYLAHSNEISVSFKNLDGTTPKKYQVYTQNISSLSNSETSPEIRLHEIQKPDSGKYLVEITSNQDSSTPFDLTIFVYDVDANLTNLTTSGIAGTTTNPTALEINYNKNDTSKMTSYVNFNNLLLDIQNFEDNSLIAKHYVAYELKQLTTAAINSNIENKARYITALKSTINWYSSYINETTKTNLIKRLDNIQKNL